LSPPGELQALIERGEASRPLEELKATERYSFDQLARSRAACAPGNPCQGLDPSAPRSTDGTWGRLGRDMREEEFRTPPRVAWHGETRLDRPEDHDTPRLMPSSSNLLEHNAAGTSGQDLFLNTEVDGLIRACARCVRSPQPHVYIEYNDRARPELWQNCVEVSARPWPGRSSSPPRMTSSQCL